MKKLLIFMSDFIMFFSAAGLSLANENAKHLRLTAD
ncbi:hypothetical protein SAMN05216352_1423 [Alteribacillus bidgolensis]|uniref:Uncharacterized protein n=1 Tax=Alteribacillus bidgolensis TaxID=930129 RepID=A0A1G8S4Q5_9BACI|nr:hypothetical protein SAMN05216352_1423 [Alteribacillus bidgolensis]